MGGSVSREEIHKTAKALVDLTIDARDVFQKVQAMINTTRKIVVIEIYMFNVMSNCQYIMDSAKESKSDLPI